LERETSRELLNELVRDIDPDDSDVGESVALDLVFRLGVGNVLVSVDGVDTLREPREFVTDTDEVTLPLETDGSSVMELEGVPVRDKEAETLLVREGVDEAE
jgi:hypothetical protein